MTLAACGDPPPPSVKDIQAQEAEKAAQSIDFSANAEIANIKARHELTSTPGMIGYIILMNEAGQPVFYGSVKGKITSSGKRLTPPDQNRKYKPVWNGDSRVSAIGPAPSDEGTWGSSDPYIYFWTAEGQYMQWNGAYLYSNSPIRLNVQPLVVSLGEATTKIVPEIRAATPQTAPAEVQPIAAE